MERYYTESGIFKEENEKLIFSSRQLSYTKPDSNEQIPYLEQGRIFFLNDYKDGIIEYDISFTNVDDKTRFGILFNYKNTSGKPYYYVYEIRNDTCGYSLYHHEGEKGKFEIYSGSGGTLQANKKYTIKLEKTANRIKAYANGAELFTHDVLENLGGNVGIDVCNQYNSVIENIKVTIKKPTVFSIMKFEKDFDELYHEVIIPKFRQYGYSCVRADECYTSSPIIQDIIREIEDASIIIADITMDNPNVFYELGYAHALKKPTILLADKNKRDKLPFDISGFRTIFYTNTIGGKREIENILGKYIENISR